jgi:putative molybdopterin biosynthesis protein
MEKNMATHNLLKGDEVAEILKISRTKAFSLMAQGTIPSIRIGHNIRVEEADLDEYIKNNKSSTGPFSTFTK